MKKLLVCFIAIAMSIGFALTPAMAQNEDDPHYPWMYVDPGGIGDLLLFSLYDVRPGVDGRGPLWENYIAIENTSGKWTAFHLRFRAWKKSIEVFDHVILLSPYDVFWMSLSLAPGTGDTTYPCDAAQYPVECPNGWEQYHAGDVLMYSADTHTLWNSALIYENLVPSQTFWLDKFQDSMLVFNGFNSDNGAAPKAEMQAGYIEAIGLWQLSVPGGKSEDTHDLKEVVTNVHPDPAVPGETINVNDALDALFYRFFTSLGAAQASYFGAPQMNPPGYPPGHAIYDCRDARNFVGCWSKYPINSVIDSAWPDFSPRFWVNNSHPQAPPLPGGPAGFVPKGGPFGPVVRIERVTNGGLGDQNLVFTAESPGATRYGEDCGNVLAGNVAYGDPADGKYQMENFIAIKNFRTDAYGPQWSHIYYTTGYGRDFNDDDWCDEKTNHNWVHRDGYPGGGIFFPASIGEWFYQVANTFTGGAAELYFWYYVNPSVTTAAGPILVDGNDFAGMNFNDVQGSARWNNPERGFYTNVGGSFYDYNRMLINYGLPRPFPFNRQAIENDAYAFVHYFNDIWSLDDLEAALAKYQIWYTHLRTRIADGAKGNLDTDVVMTYPTKHDHYFFTDWPFMWHPWMGYCFGDMRQVGPSPVNNNHLNQYWANLLEYRGDEDLTNNPGIKGRKSVEKLIIFASRADDIAEEKFIEPEYNINNLTVANWFESRWFNGRIYLQASIWDNEQNRPPGSPELPPPGSPWYPDPRPPKWAPHEVNIARAGATHGWDGSVAPGQIDDLNWLLAAAKGDFGKGHFRIDQSYLYLGQRILWDWNEDLDESFGDVEPHGIYYGTDYLLPPIGIVILNHNFGETQNGVTRSAMAEWHYIKHWLEYDLACKDFDLPNIKCSD